MTAAVVIEETTARATTQVVVATTAVAAAIRIAGLRTTPGQRVAAAMVMAVRTVETAPLWTTPAR